MIDVKIFDGGRLVEHVFAGQKEKKAGNSPGVGRFVYHKDTECMAKLGEQMCFVQYWISEKPQTKGRRGNKA